MTTDNSQPYLLLFLQLTKDQGPRTKDQGPRTKDQGPRTKDQGPRTSPAAAGGAGRRGFTLIELLVVVVIIAIILGFVLAAGIEAAHRAEERATQTLIAKLEGGLNDRLEALLQNRPEPNYTHAYLAAIWSSAAVSPADPIGMIPSPYPLDSFTGLSFPNSRVKQTQRAQTFAWYDYIKSELPDVFFLQNDPNYPINFGATPFPGTPIDAKGYGNYILPLGHAIQGPLSAGGYGDGNTSTGVFISSNPNLGLTGRGIFGASYPIAAGLFKNLAVPPPMVAIQPQGYDGVDNDGNGLIDEVGEWAPTTAQQNAIVTLLQTNHQHKTARSEMLYAILVEGQGPFGSVFSRDEFTDKEVRDTDGDGLPEFVDAWGQPLQFFRWPVLYHSDLQRGQNIVPTPGVAQSWSLPPPYQIVYQEREQDPLDVSRQLVAPGWWWQKGVSGQFAANDNFSLAPFNNNNQPAYSIGASAGAQAFELFFHRLTEPLNPNPFLTTGVLWDRGGFPFRRAFYSKFLVLSGGQDQVPGVFLYSDADMLSLGSGAAVNLIANENNALPFALDILGGGTDGFKTQVSIPVTSPNTVPTFLYGPSTDPTRPSSYDLLQGGQDDISNHNLQATGGIGGSG
ncbi:MAG: prepilin-type N-terminal cleavage/methylation domain-containing protein [Isosphaerales bacterium]